eukprot:505572_1
MNLSTTTLSSIDILSSLINSFDTRISDKNAPICICGNHLVKLEDATEIAELYTGGVDRCNECHDDITEHNVIWNCPQEFNTHHPDGYDICNYCLHNVTEVPSSANNFIFNLSNFMNRPSQKPQHCQDMEQNCTSLQNFIFVMNSYHQNDVKVARNMSKSKLVKILNDYLHLLQQHDNGFKFQTIFNYLSCCDIKSCAITERYNRNRIPFTDSGNETSDGCMLAFSIMDKMHFYFHHSYDVGNRLSVEEQTVIDKISNENKYDHDEHYDQHMLNHKRFEINKIIQSKQQMRELCSQFSDYGRSKYTKLFENQQEHKDTNHHITMDNLFSFGNAFEYTYDGEITACAIISKVSAKYSSFKRELLENPFVTMNIKQFNNEYKKANIHSESQFCKNNKCFQTYNDTDMMTLKVTQWKLDMQYLLAVMIYCNYTQLQYVFSKTYRDDNIVNHKNFYYWGKYLKIAVHHFGTKLRESFVKKFYHGVSHQLYLPQYNGISNAVGIGINGPFSTSSSFAVAATFANHAGLIIEIQLTQTFMNTGGKCFPAAWLSDYPGEKEHLFLQCGCSLSVTNIVEVNSGYEYENILTAAHLIRRFTDGCFSEIKEVDESMKMVIQRMFEGQLSKILSKYRLFKTTKLAKHIIDARFVNSTDLEIHYWKLRKYLPGIFEFLVHTDHEWLNLHLINILFPNVSCIVISHINLCSFIFEDILKFTNNFSTNLIIIDCIKRHSQLSIKNAICKYSQRFRQKQLFIYCDYRYPGFTERMYIQKCDELEFMTKVISMMNGMYYQDANNEIMQQIEILVENKLSASNKTDHIQSKFDSLCADVKVVEIFWSVLSNDRDSYLFKLLSHSNVNTWIKIDVLIGLLPNVAMLQVLDCKLSIKIIEDIFNSLTRGKTELRSIVLENIVEETISRQEVVNQYANKFEAINWVMTADDSEFSKEITVQKRG